MLFLFVSVVSPPLFYSFFLLFFSFFLIFPVQLVFGHYVLTRRKNSPLKKESETVLSPRVTKFGLKFNVRKPIQKHNYKATSGSRKKHKGFKRLHDCII